MEPRKPAPEAPGWGPRGVAGSRTAAELVYHLAGALGTELKELARRFGPEAAAGLVPLVVRALELLEEAAVGPAPDSVSHCSRPRPPRGRPGPAPENPTPQLQVSAQQAELELRRLREENEHLRRELRSGPQEERALLRQLKEVTDRQRDELRAHNRDLQQRSLDAEAVRAGRGHGRGGAPSAPRPPATPLLRPQLQEQLQRLLLVNAELRHKLAAVQTQLRAARDRESEQEVARDQAGVPGCEERQEPEPATAGAGAPGTPEGLVEQCGFSREELEQILQERNELKANVFLLKEELAYFQRELLTDHRVPGLLLEAMKVAVRKQRKKIKAKMLGTPEEAESSDDEDGWLLLSSDKGDHPPPPESRIQSFFGLSYRGEAEAKMSSMAPGEQVGDEGVPRQSHLEPVSCPPAPSSSAALLCSQ
ncbi:hypothetical protein MC885_019055 [Smutsia gigantea]|nr:hypothetical protein MC885_019055 [Smutsia gigantea]